MNNSICIMDIIAI